MALTTGFDNKDGRLRGRAGQARRLRIWSLNPHCADCGKLTAWPKGFQIDHRIPLFKGGPDTDDNLQVLCCGAGGCHDKKTAIEKGADLAVAWFPEWLEPAIGHLTLVCGPPASGKSTYVQEHKGEYDTVIDIDQIISDISGLPLYHAGKEWMMRGAYLRNKILASLSRDRRPAWFIVTGRGKDERAWWERKLKPTTVVVLDVKAAVCVARINADARRPDEVKARHIEGVKKWWLAETGQGRSNERRTQFDADGRVVW